ncbi:hypothetical protein OIU74_011153 [Salix koriyanagi]|uniref:Uncharacterized protein n=1 Tax=Salix koriyanagi TaxID=2511006 RepID=A0A9Q0TEL4_9ROSI|nr:hypothetical protein OIU74_011153 [Salix koriyanagi]
MRWLSTRKQALNHVQAEMFHIFVTLFLDFGIHVLEVNVNSEGDYNRQ